MVMRSVKQFPPPTLKVVVPQSCPEGEKMLTDCSQVSLDPSRGRTAHPPPSWTMCRAEPIRESLIHSVGAYIVVANGSNCPIHTLLLTPLMPSHTNNPSTTRS